MIFKSFSSDDTRRFAKDFARALVRSASRERKRKNALVLALTGDLGSGKTTFVQGFLRGMGIKKRTASPTFILFRRFSVPRAARGEARFRSVFHVDAYRIAKPKELLALGFGEVLRNPEHIVIVEWAENIRTILPKKRNSIRFTHKTERNRRDILVR